MASSLKLSLVLLTWVMTFLPATRAVIKQELHLYFDAEGNDCSNNNYIYFSKNNADISAYRQLLPLVKSYCATGLWWAYNNKNYQNIIVGLGDEGETEKVCKNFTFNSPPPKSLRHWVSSDLTEKALSLYSKTRYEGKEIIVPGDANALTNIKTPVSSITSTGPSNWTLFEGRNLNGESFCFQKPVGSQYPPSMGVVFSWYYDVQSQLNLTKIGSVIRSCDSEEIRQYKEQRNLL